MPNKNNYGWIGTAALVALLATCALPADGVTIAPGIHAQLRGRIRQGPIGPPATTGPQAQPGNPGAPAAASATPKPSQPEAEPAPPQTAPAPQAVPASMLNQPPTVAEVRFTSTSLYIHAQNSSLNEILQTISSHSGMKIEGLGGDERVFGNFGPGQPQDVLSQLLNGTPYNVLMVGGLSNGAPRQLVLTPAIQTPESEADNSVQPPTTADNSSDDEATDENAPGQAIPKMHNPQGIRSPQQIFQELQRIRQQQKQQQPQEQQQPQQ